MTRNKTNYQFSWQCLDFLKSKSRGFIYRSHAAASQSGIVLTTNLPTAQYKYLPEGSN